MQRAIQLSRRRADELVDALLVVVVDRRSQPLQLGAEHSWQAQLHRHVPNGEVDHLVERLVEVVPLDADPSAAGAPGLVGGTVGSSSEPEVPLGAP